MRTIDERPLWFTVPGAPRWVPALWLGWMLGAPLVGGALLGAYGPAGALVVVGAIGWMLARRLPAPRESLCRYHLDDVELTAMGPGRRVRRLPWSAIDTLTQERRVLRLEGDGATIRLPLRPLVESAAWGAVLARTVPALAGEMWALLEEGEPVRLAPSLDPPTSGLFWWAWAPATLTALAAAGGAGLGLLAALALAERAVALVRTRARAVALHRGGAGVRRRLWATIVSWPRLEVVRVPDGLLLTSHGRTCGLVRCGLPNFWAAAPVIEMRAHLGPRAGATVHFRVRVAADGPAVVGEVESSG
jgi:hypothetical protein